MGLTAACPILFDSFVSLGSLSASSRALGAQGWDSAEFCLGLACANRPQRLKRDLLWHNVFGTTEVVPFPIVPFTGFKYQILTLRTSCSVESAYPSCGALRRPDGSEDPSPHDPC